MKKLIVGTVLLASVVSAGVSFAGYGKGHNNGNNHSGYTMNQGQGCGMRGMQSDAMQKFHSDNSELFKQMTEKRAELQALTIATTPDIAQVGKVAGELYDIRMNVHDMAMTSGVAEGVHRNMRGNNIDEATMTKMVEFNKTNRDLKKQLVVKQAEKRALLSMDSPSPEKAKALAGEIFDIRNSLSAKAEKAGIPVQLACAPMGGNGGGKRHDGVHRGDMDNNSNGKGRHNGGHWN